MIRQKTRSIGRNKNKIQERPSIAYENFLCHIQSMEFICCRVRNGMLHMSFLGDSVEPPNVLWFSSPSLKCDHYWELDKPNKTQSYKGCGTISNVNKKLSNQQFHIFMVFVNFFFFSVCIYFSSCWFWDPKNNKTKLSQMQKRTVWKVNSSQQTLWK